MSWFKSQVERLVKAGRHGKSLPFNPAASDMPAEVARCLSDQGAWGSYDNDALLALAFHGLMFYGATADEDMILHLFPLYQTLLRRVDDEARFELAAAVTRAIENEATGINAMLPFLLLDHSSAIVSTAVLDFVFLRESPDGDPLRGAKEAVEWIARGVPKNTGAILGGLITVGDDRIHQLLVPLRSEISVGDIDIAVRCRSGFPTVATFEFWLSWLELLVGEDEQAEFGAVASGLALLRRSMRVPHFLTGRRPLGVGPRVKDLPPTDSDVTVSIEDVGRQFEARLYALEAAESAPKLLSHVLIGFGLEPRAPLAERFVVN